MTLYTRFKISKLRKYFLSQPEIIMAFLFGSRAKGIFGRISDWDIAVYFKPKGRLEYEEIDKEYPLADKIWSDLIYILESEDIDLVVLNRASSNIAASAISEGIPLVIKDPKILLNFMTITMRQAEQYREFVDNYFTISQRSQSLTFKDRETLKKQIDFLEQEISLSQYYSSFTFSDYNDIHKRHDVERWIENIINSCIDVGEIILASQKKRIPNYYSDIFLELGIIPEFRKIDSTKFVDWVKLRNILAHEYLDIKWRRIEGFIKDAPPQLEIFLQCSKKFI